MPEIIQQFGFEASGAISTISRLNTSLAALTINLGNVSRAAGLLNKGGADKSLNNLATSAKKANAALEKTGTSGAANINKVNKAVKRATTSTKSFNISLETLSRIAIAQGIVRGLNTIQAKFSQAIDTAVELGSTLAEAAAISPRGIEDFSSEISNLNQQLIASSNAFGIDVLDLANAKYQEFSNQVKGAAESTALFDNANRLAVITGTSATQAVDALSSALNSYGEGVDGAERASAILFKTIELSRAKLGEIAGQLGNVTPLARDAGISFIEVGAALSVITQGGTGASRALTQIRGLINQLQKPTQELQRIFTEVFRVQNIQQAIQKFGGLAPVLQAIQVEANKTADGFSKIFTNIRARTAISRLTQDAGLLSGAVDKITDTANNAGSVLGSLLSKFKEQDAQKFKIAIQELNNAFLVMAQDALPTITKLMGTFATATTHLGTILKILASATLVRVGLAFGNAALAAKNAAGNFAGAGASILAVGVGIGLAVAALVELSDAFTVANFKTAPEGLAKSTKAAMQVIADETKNAEKALREFAAEGKGAFSSFQASAFAAQTAIKTVNDAFTSSIGTSLDSVVAGREAILKKLESIISGFASRTEKRTRDSAKINQKIEDRAFERRISNFSETREAAARQQRAEEALSKAQQAPGADTTEGLQKRIELLKEAERLADASVAAAQKGGNRGQEFRASQNQLDISRALIGTNKELQIIDDKRRVSASQALSVEKTRIENLKTATKDFRALLSINNKDGTIKSKQQLEADKKRIAEVRKEITKLALAGDDLSGADIVGLAGLQDQIAKDLEGISPKFTGIKDSLVKALEQAGREATVTINVKALVKTANVAGAEIDPNAIDQVGNVAASREFLLERLGTLNTGIKDIKEGMVQATEAAAQFDKQVGGIVEHNTSAVGAFASIFGSFASGLFGGAETAKAAAGTFQEAVDTFLAAPLAEGALQKLGDALDTLNRGGGDLPGVKADAELAVGKDLLGNAQKLITAELKKKNAAELTGSASVTALEQEKATTTSVLLELDKVVAKKQANKAVQDQITDASKNTAVTAGKEAEAFGQAATAAGEVKTNTENLPSSLGAGATAAGNLASQLSKAATQAERLAKAQASGGEGGAAASRMFGGPMYRAFGGFVPRGSDTIPAMLSPGETVINARSSRRFASQISAMNAGTSPVYRANGGVVNNNSVNVGDINVNGAASPDATARRVAQELRREFRRGTSSRL